MQIKGGPKKTIRNKNIKIKILKIKGPTTAVQRITKNLWLYTPNYLLNFCL